MKRANPRRFSAAQHLLVALRMRALVLDDEPPKREQPATQRVPRETIVADALSDVFRMLNGADETARKRELRAQARSYDQAIKHWTAVPPTFAQLDAMFDLMMDLHGKVVALGRRARK